MQLSFPGQQTNTGLADTNHPIRSCVNFVLLPVLLLFISLVNHCKTFYLLLCQFTFSPQKLIKVFSVPAEKGASVWHQFHQKSLFRYSRRNLLLPYPTTFHQPGGISSVLYAKNISLMPPLVSSVRHLRNSTKNDGTKRISV